MNMNKRLDQQQIKVVIIGGGRGGTSLFSAFFPMDGVEIVGLADINPQAPAIAMAREKGIPAWQDFQQMLAQSQYDVVVEATGLEEVCHAAEEIKHPGSILIVAEAALLMMRLIEAHESLVNTERDVEWLSAIMDAAQEGIEMADNDGIIRYVNEAFSWITKVKAEERVGHSVFDVSPNGALAEVLRTGKPVFGKFNIVLNSGVEVLSNASPMMVKGKMVGAVVLFRDVSDIRKMGQRLGESREVIRNLQEELRQLTTSQYRLNDIIGNSDTIKKVLHLARQAAQDAATVLITGESGTGKELLSHAIHAAGPRRDRPFVKVDCASIPENLLESILFGHEKGAFTGAIKSKMGKFELADGGTIFLDEIGELAMPLQSKLLRVLQEREVERIGANQPVRVDVRVIAATNRNLQQAVLEGRFRQDLYYRLNVIHLNLPPLRERLEDIPLLVEEILKRKNFQYKKNCALGPEVMEQLMSYEWPGNVRELENVIERGILLSEDNLLCSTLVKNFLEGVQLPGQKGRRSLRELEEEAIKEAIQAFGSNLEGKKKASQSLGISLATLYNKMAKYNLRNQEGDSKK